MGGRETIKEPFKNLLKHNKMSEEKKNDQVTDSAAEAQTETSEATEATKTAKASGSTKEEPTQSAPTSKPAANKPAAKDNEAKTTETTKTAVRSLEAVGKRILAAHPKHAEVYVISNGRAFFNQADATNAARGLTNKTVTTVKR